MNKGLKKGRRVFFSFKNLYQRRAHDGTRCMLPYSRNISGLANAKAGTYRHFRNGRNFVQIRRQVGRSPTGPARYAGNSYRVQETA